MGVRSMFAAALALILVPSARGQDGTIRSVDDLTRLSPSQLDTLYASARPAAMPDGRVRGLPLIAPGTRLGPARSKAARAAWQGKVFDPNASTAVNRFFGVRAIRGNLSYGPSWRDGRQSLILDYQGTSTIYGRYRDEIREVAPGTYLGLMFDRTTSPPTFVRYFSLDTRGR